MFQNNLPQSTIQEGTELGFKLRSGSKATVATVLGDLLTEWWMNFRSRSQRWILQKGDLRAHKGRFQLQVGSEHAKVNSDLFHVYIKRQNF